MTPSFQRPNRTYTRRSVNIKFFKKLAYLKKALTRFSVCNSVMPTNETERIGTKIRVERKMKY